MPKDLFLKTRQKTKIRNAFASNMFMHIKLIKAEFPKTLQSEGFLCKTFRNLGKKVLLHLAVPKLKMFCLN